MELGLAMNDESMELILSYCDKDNKGGIDFTSFVKHFEANGRGWFNPFNEHKRLPDPPFRPRADQVCVRMCVYAYVYTCTHVYIPQIYTHKHKHKHIYILVHALSKHIEKNRLMKGRLHFRR